MYESYIQRYIYWSKDNMWVMRIAVKLSGTLQVQTNQVVIVLYICTHAQQLHIKYSANVMQCKVLASASVLS